MSFCLLIQGADDDDAIAYSCSVSLPSSVSMSPLVASVATSVSAWSKDPYFALYRASSSICSLRVLRTSFMGARRSFSLVMGPLPIAMWRTASEVMHVCEWKR